MNCCVLKKAIIYIVGSVAFISSCDAPENTAVRSARCYARFDAGTGEQTAEFSFFNNAPGAQEQAIEIRGGIFYQGVSMPLRKIPAPAYRQSYKAACSPEQRFSWKNAHGEDVVFALIMPKIDSFWFDKPTLPIDSPATLFWSGGGLEKGETLVLLWENTATGQSISVEVYADGLPSSIVLPATKMKELAPGNWSLYLIRKKLTLGAAGGVNASGVAEYYTAVKNIRIR